MRSHPQHQDGPHIPFPTKLNRLHTSTPQLSSNARIPMQSPMITTIHMGMTMIHTGVPAKTMLTRLRHFKRTEPPASIKNSPPLTT